MLEVTYKDANQVKKSKINILVRYYELLSIEQIQITFDLFTCSTNPLFEDEVSRNKIINKCFMAKEYKEK